MKKFFLIALTLVLTAAMFTACGCTNRNKPEMTTPTGMTEIMPTIATTAPTTVPTTEATRPTPEESTPTGNGPLEDSTGDPTGTNGGTEPTAENRSRMMPGRTGSSR